MHVREYLHLCGYIFAYTCRPVDADRPWLWTPRVRNRTQLLTRTHTCPFSHHTRVLILSSTPKATCTQTFTFPCRICFTFARTFTPTLKLTSTQRSTDCKHLQYHHLSTHPKPIRASTLTTKCADFQRPELLRLRCEGMRRSWRGAGHCAAAAHEGGRRYRQEHCRVANSDYSLSVQPATARLLLWSLG